MTEYTVIATLDEDFEPQTIAVFLGNVRKEQVGGTMPMGYYAFVVEGANSEDAEISVHATLKMMAEGLPA